MNWKLRLKNKTTLMALIACVVAFAYQLLGVFEISAPISQAEVMQIVGLFGNVLVTLGVLVDPTTRGIADSKRAKEYTEPN